MNGGGGRLVFGCYCYILNDKENLGKFDSKSDNGIFLDYATNSKSYRIFNIKNQTMEISMPVIFDEFDDFVINKEGEEESFHKDVNNDQKISSQNPSKSWKTIGDHPPEQIIGDTSDVQIKHKSKMVIIHMFFIT